MEPSAPSTTIEKAMDTKFPQRPLDFCALVCAMDSLILFCVTTPNG